MQCPQCKTGTIRVQTTVGYTGDRGRGTHPLFCDNTDCFTQFHGVGMAQRSTTALAEMPERVEVDQRTTNGMAHMKQRPDWLTAHAQLLRECPTVEAWHEAELAKGLYVPGESSPST